MKIRNLDIGVETITRWEEADETHLPREKAPSARFLPQSRPLDEVLRRPSLDERLPQLLQPVSVAPELLEPYELTMARLGAHAAFADAARQAVGRRKKALETAASILDEDLELEEEVREALAALLRG